MKRVPPALLLGFGISALFLVVEVVHQLVSSDIGSWIKWSLVGAGGGFAYTVIAIYGLRELARGRGGNVALGANVAIAGIVIALSASLAFDVLVAHEGWLTQSRIEILSYAFLIAAVVELVGFAIAARVSLPTGIGVVLVGVIAHAPQIVARPIYEALALGETSSRIVHSTLELVQIAILIALAVVACRDRALSPAPHFAIEGLRRASSSFWLRLIAALAIPATTLLFAVGGGGGRDADTIMRVALMTSAFASLIALVVFAVGAVRASQAGIADLNGIVLLVGGTLALWCAGVGLQELPQLYRMFYGGGWGQYDAANAEQVFPILLPLVGIAAVTAVVTAIHRFASRRAFADLIRQATANGTWFVAFSLTSIAVQNWLLPNVQTSSGGVIMLLTLAISGIVTNVAMARLCEQAANAIDREASLPTATVISGPA